VAVERASHEITLRKIQEEAVLAKTNMEHELAETSARLAYQNENQTKELAQLADQARADLDAELSARRSEAEKELLETHQKAVELNNSFLKEAETQLSETRGRLEALRVEHKKLIAAIEEANLSGKTASQKTAAQTIENAEKRAAEILRAAEEEAISRVAAAERRLVELRNERDSIAEYVESLRTILGGALEMNQPVDPKKQTTKNRPKLANSPAAGKRQNSAAS
jgi:chromosome segregation ATPase